MQHRSLLAALLDDQGDLSAVERFAQRHERATEPSLARHYRDLVPLSRRARASSTPLPSTSTRAPGARPASPPVTT
jgi:hypothetical protein